MCIEIPVAARGWEWQRRGEWCDYEGLAWGRWLQICVGQDLNCGVGYTDMYIDWFVAVVSNIFSISIIYTLKIIEDLKELLYMWTVSVNIYHIWN